MLRLMYNVILDNLHERMFKETKIEMVWSFRKIEKNASVSKMCVVG